MTSVDQVFDSYAPDYDKEFSHTWLGAYYRRRVQRYMQLHWPGKQSILELNAGTGEDAVFLASLGNKVLATDSSFGMLSIAASKSSHSRLAGAIEFKQLKIEELDAFKGDVLKGAPFDGLLSNFGGLNCTEDFQAFAKSAASVVRKDGIVMLCIMGRWVPWEWLWYTVRGRPGKGFRRLSGKTEWRGAAIYYPKVKAVIDAMNRASFHLLEKEGLGIVMPPSYVSKFVDRWPSLFSQLAKIENYVSKSPLLLNLADHYLLIFQKR